MTSLNPRAGTAQGFLHSAEEDIPVSLLALQRALMEESLLCR